MYGTYTYEVQYAYEYTPQVGNEIMQNRREWILVIRKRESELKKLKKKKLKQKGSHELSQNKTQFKSSPYFVQILYEL